MKIIHRVYSGIIVCIISLIGMLFFLSLPNFKELWAGAVIFAVITVGFLIYVISNYRGLKEVRQERKRLKGK
jgi:hypothetical protein